jgi:hypothetical protein
VNSRAARLSAVTAGVNLLRVRVCLLGCLTIGLFLRRRNDELACSRISTLP